MRPVSSGRFAAAIVAIVALVVSPATPASARVTPPALAAGDAYGPAIVGLFPAAHAGQPQLHWWIVREEGTYDYLWDWTTECALEGAAPAPCTPETIEATTFAPGQHTMTLTPVGPDGTERGRPATWRFVVDPTPPVVDWGPSGVVVKGTAPVTLLASATDDESGVAYVTCASGENDRLSVRCGTDRATVPRPALTPAVGWTREVWVRVFNHAGVGSPARRFTITWDAWKPAVGLVTGPPLLTRPGYRFAVSGHDDSTARDASPTLRLRARYRTAAPGGRPGRWITPPTWSRAVRAGSLLRLRLPRAAPGHRICVQGGAVDPVGRSNWTPTRCTMTLARDSDVRLGRGWRPRRVPGATHRRVVASDTPGATAVIPGTKGGRGVAIRFRTCSSCGYAVIETPRGTQGFMLRSREDGWRLFTDTWAKPSSAPVRVSVYSGPVAIDGFAVTSDPLVRDAYRFVQERPGVHRWPPVYSQAR